MGDFGKEMPLFGPSVDLGAQRPVGRGAQVGASLREGTSQAQRLGGGVEISQDCAITPRGLAHGVTSPRMEWAFPRRPWDRPPSPLLPKIQLGASGVLLSQSLQAGKQVQSPVRLEDSSQKPPSVLCESSRHPPVYTQAQHRLRLLIGYSQGGHSR